MRCFGGTCSTEAQEIPCHTVSLLPQQQSYMSDAAPGQAGGRPERGEKGAGQRKAQAVLPFVLRSGDRAADASDCMDSLQAPGDLPR